MIFEIVVDPVAERAILDQINYIGVNQQSPINAVRVLDAIENAKHRFRPFLSVARLQMRMNSSPRNPSVTC